MKCRLIPEPFPWTVGPVRTPGLHLSEIIQGIVTDLTGQKRGDTDDPRLQFEKGFLWENLLSLAFAEQAAVRPGEVELDGIICSPDGVDFEPGGEMVLEEYKCTMMSCSKNPPADVLKWMIQVKGYCYVLGTTRAKMRILYLAGSWNPPVPEYRVYEFEFTPDELRENWVMVKNYADKIRKRERGNVGGE
uniref:YqaJ viral recombinase domain-containing protein n=1 Tax=viral metagenome TaxID=1070528 RepID=A0A6M3IJM5_9ZZZZ